MSVELYDTTLRDGVQQEGLTPSVADKLRVARILDGLGVAYVEGGWPGANPKDTELFRRAAAGELVLERAQLVAFGMTRRPGRDAASDPVVSALLEADTPVVTVVAKASPAHVAGALSTSLEENLAMVTDTVALLRSEGRRVVLDAEHYVDGHAEDPAYAVQVLEAAAQAGAECVVLCDTNGGALPDRVAAVVAEAVALLGPTGTRVGVHVHDDAGCAVASSMAAVAAGAAHVQGTVNGIGERCGNANLLSVAANLVLKRGVEVLAPADLARLAAVSHEVAEVLNLVPDPQQPYVGASAFAHKAGLHASATARFADAYQHVEPARVGNRRRMLVSELAGRASIAAKATELGLDLDDAAASRVLERVKELEHGGATFEAADASFAVLVLAETGAARPPFALESYRAGTERRPDGTVLADATVRVVVREERLLGAGEGTGPVDALDHAFRSAVGGRLPVLERLRLVDYKVRILEAAPTASGRLGTAATTRVLVTCTDGEEELTTVGVSANVIDASWHALADAYFYAWWRLTRTP